MACSETQSLLYSVYSSPNFNKPKGTSNRQDNTDLHYLGERFHNPGVFVAVHLYRVNERHLSLWVVTERL